MFPGFCKCHPDEFRFSCRIGPAVIGMGSSELLLHRLAFIVFPRIGIHMIAEQDMIFPCRTLPSHDMDMMHAYIPVIHDEEEMAGASQPLHIIPHAAVEHAG